MKKKFFDNIIESQSFANAALPTFNFNIFLAAIAALYLGSSLTHSLTHGMSNIWAESNNSVIFQHRDFKFSPKNLKKRLFNFLVFFLNSKIFRKKFQKISKKNQNKFKTKKYIFLIEKKTFLLFKFFFMILTIARQDKTGRDREL